MTKKEATFYFGTHIDTCDFCYICSEWWENVTWPTKRQLQRQRQWQIHLENTSKCGLWDLWSLRHFPFEWWENIIWPTKRQRQRQRQWQIHSAQRTPSKCNLWDLWPLRHLLRPESNEKTWSEQQKDNDKDKNKYNDNYNLRTPSKKIEITIKWQS